MGHEEWTKSYIIIDALVSMISSAYGLRLTSFSTKAACKGFLMTNDYLCMLAVLV